MRILWVKTSPLHPLDTGGKKRSHAMLVELSKQHDVCYLSLLDNSVSLSPEEEPDSYAATKEWVHWKQASKKGWALGLELLANLPTTLPYALAKYRSTALQKRLADYAKAQRFDLVICDFLAPALNFIGHSFRVPVVLFQHNMEAQIWKRLSSAQPNALKRAYFSSQYRRMSRWERKLSQIFDGIITVSPEDTLHARTTYGLTNVWGDVPTGVNIEHFTTGSPSPTQFPSGPPTVGFLGSMDWLPNIDSVEYFAREILPLVQRQIPDVRFKIIGRNPTVAVQKLAANGSIEVTGTVEDVRPHVRQCHVIVVPLRAGGGTRIKIFEAMAIGVPVVSTTIGAEGLPVTHGKDILIADESAIFADAVSHLLRTPSDAQALATMAQNNVRANHSWAAATSRFMELCQTQLPKT